MLYSKASFFHSQIFKFNLVFNLLLATLIVGLAIFFAKHPLYFMKLVTLKPTSEINKLIEIDQSQYFKVRPLISKIPYKGKNISTILPEERYRKTILEGYGECSNFSYGMAYHLGKNNFNYLILHIFDPSAFPFNGHVAIQAAYSLNNTNHIGIIDILEGGVVVNDGAAIGIENLLAGQHHNISILPLNRQKDKQAYFYREQYLSTAIIGIMLSSEVENYFNFVTEIFIDLDNDKLERFLHIGLATIVGKYPTIYIDETDYDQLMEGKHVDKTLAQLMTWAIRLLILMALMMVITLPWARLMKNRSIPTN